MTEGQPIQIENPLSDADKARGKAISEYLAARARTLPAVRIFRSLFLQDRPFTSQEADALVRSAQAAIAPAAMMARYADRPLLERVSVEATPLEPTQQRWSVQLTFCDGAVLTSELSRTDLQRMPYPIDEEDTAFFYYWPGSFLDELARLAAALHEGFWFTYPDAAAFVLTDEVPRIAALNVIDAGKEIPGIPPLTTHFIVMQAASWLSASVVAEAFRQAQKKIIGNHDNRPLRDNTLELVRFLARSMRDDGTMPRPRELMGLWNAEHPEAPYENLVVFRRATTNAVRRLWPAVARKSNETPDNPNAIGAPGSSDD
jgi:hypothetical protein